MVLARSRRHLEEAGKAYGPHGRFAVRAGFLLIWAGLTSILHGLVPAWFPFYSRDVVRSLADRSRAGDDAGGR